MSVAPTVRIQLTGFGSIWRVGRIEITTLLQQESVFLNLSASSYDAAVALGKRHAVEMAKSMGYQAEGLQWDIHPRRPNPPSEFV